MHNHRNVMSQTGTSIQIQEPRTARVTSRTSGEGNPVRPAGVLAKPKPKMPAKQQTTVSAQLLRHNLTSPEKKTLKRIEALRRGLQSGFDDDGHAVDRDSVGARIFDHLRIDRGLAGNVADDCYATLAGRLVDPLLLATPAATVVGGYLRETGATERGLVTPERVKQALHILNDALYDHDQAAAPIPSSVRELKLEKRDGGLQIAAILRVGASEDVALSALTLELRRAGFADVVVRTTPAPLAPAPRAGRMPLSR